MPAHVLCRIINLTPGHRMGIPFMKPQTARLPEPTMRFFTPELFVRFNAADDEKADEANDAWESALSAYREHLDAIRDQMPSQVRKLAELCLHDAELVAYDQAFPFELFPPFWSAMAIVSVKHDSRITSLIYLLGDRIREHASSDDWPFSKARTHWLYDEVDLAPSHRGGFLHRVLLSDGRVLEIPFLSALVHDVLLTQTNDEKSTEHGARRCP